MNIGSLYRVKKWHWMIFPSKESAAAARIGVRSSDAATEFWSKYYNENVTCLSPDSYIIFLEQDGDFKKVLTSEGLIGWTWFKESYNDSFEEVNQP